MDTRSNKFKKGRGDKGISAVIIAKDDEKIFDCIRSVAWCDEVIVIDTGLDNERIVRSKKLGAGVYKYEGGSFNDWRNEGLKRAKGDWVLYIDTDERVTEELKSEILKLVSSFHHVKRGSLFTFSNNVPVAYAIPRRNIILGKEMRHGGWWPDYVKRLFKKSALKKWRGELHEEPIFEGVMGHLENSLIHIKEDNLSDMVRKTNTWSEIEAKLMFDAGHPQMNLPRFFSVIFREFWYRFGVKKAFLDGAQGIIFGIYQVYSRFISYAKLWELQNEVKSR